MTLVRIAPFRLRKRAIILRILRCSLAMTIHATVPAYAEQSVDNVLGCVVPAKAGTHTPCTIDLAIRSTPSLNNECRWLWVPAFAGTTIYNFGWDEKRITQTSAAPPEPTTVRARCSATTAAGRVIRTPPE